MYQLNSWHPQSLRSATRTACWIVHLIAPYLAAIFTPLLHICYHEASMQREIEILLPCTE